MQIINTINSIKESIVKKLYPDYNVIVYNDNFVYYLTVIKGLTEVVGLSTSDAEKIMMVAHNNGKATVITCSQERAEAYQEALLQRGLTITIEKNS